jgi:class 3 adenylate cyclase/tetratricopeptide (TPR) repeat protein
VTEDLPAGTLTILFTDLEGSTDLRTRLGDEAAQGILRSHEAVVREQIEGHGGQQVKSLGDGFMAAFVSARRAVDCAIAIQRALDTAVGDAEGLRVRVGVNAGEAITEGGELYGAAVNAAARIAAAASGGQVLVAQTIRDLAGTMPGLDFVDRGLFWLKGFPERWRLYEVARTEDRSPTAPVLMEERTPFVGREQERADLRRFLDGALAGHGALVLIGGEPGVGKTRLAEEVAAEAARRGMLPLVGHCYESDGAPFTPLVEILDTAARIVPPEVFRETLGDTAGEVARLLPELKRLFPDIPAPLELPPEQERRYLLNTLREFFERTSRRRPLLLVLDDLHWADESSLLLLQHTTERLAEMPALIVGTYRDVELDVERPLAGIIESLFRRRQAHRLSLRRLSEEGVGAMLRALAGQDPPAGLLKVIYDETEGNPFFVEEVFRHLVEEGKLLDPAGRFRADLQVDELDVPEGVRLVIGRRLERLSDTARKILAGAAVIGRAFTFDLLQALSDLSVEELLDAVEEAERARLIVSTEGPEARYTFGHELIRQTLLANIVLPRRQRLHLQIADAIEEVRSSDLEQHAGDIAHHLYQAGAAADPERSVRFQALAGDRAMETAAFEDALRLYERAVSLQTDDGASRASLVFRRGLALRSLGRWDEALADWRAALAAYEAAGDVDRVGEISWEISHQLAWATRFPEALEVAGRGLAALGDRPTPERAYLLLMAGIVFSVAGNHDAGRDMIGQGLAIAEDLGDERLLGYALYCRTVELWAYWQLEEAVETGRRAVPLLEAGNDLWDLAATRGFVAFALGMLGRFDEAMAEIRESRALALRLGHRGALLIPHRMEWFVESIRRFDVAEWERYAREDIEICKSIDSPFLQDSFLWLGMLEYYRGDWDEALRRFEEAASVKVPGIWEPIHGMFLARHLAMLGHRDRALALIEQHRSFLPRAGVPNHLGQWGTLSLSIQAFVDLGERARAAELYPLVAEYLKTGTVLQAYDFRSVETLAGMAAGAGEDWPRAEDHYRRALQLAEELSISLHAPDVRHRYAEMLIERDGPGDREQARTLLGRAIEEFRVLGMPRHVEMAEEHLAKA